jgi:hypothetical protein
MQTDEFIEGWRGVMVAMGLGRPGQRAMTAAALAAAATYTMKFPRKAFRQDGSMRPLDSLSMAPDAASVSNHFLLTPLAVGAAVYLFT